MEKFAILILLTLSISCSRDSSSTRREARISELEIEAILDNQSFDCASLGGQCPGGIARLFMINRFEPQRSGVCTGFMVSPTRLVTNNHCVPSTDVCGDTYIAVYNGGTYQKTRCKSIVRTAQDVDDPNDPRRRLDYTIMEVTEPFSGEAFPLFSQNAVAGEDVSTWVIDHTGLDDFPANLFDSRITEFNCEVMDQTERASLMLLRCPIISGNSGSPALNSAGEVIGVIWGGSLGSIDSSLDLEIRRELDEVGLATEVHHFRDAASARAH